MNASYRTIRTRLVGAPQFWIGLLFIAIFWPLNWILPSVRTAYLFFPLWLGYIFTVDGLVWLRKGNSPWTRSRKQFVLLFLASAPAWWLFEVINWRTRNWEYLGGEHFGDFEYLALSTISFSTVMPAVFTTAEFVRSFRWMERFANGPRLAAARSGFVMLLFSGLVMLGLTLLWPKNFYPLVWGSIFLILEPLNHWLGRPTLITSVNHRDWRLIAALSFGALICGFFWEMWNFYSFPKWVYHTPGAEFLHVFEMPLLGYLGYLPFAWELFALQNFVWPGAPRFNHETGER